MNMRKRILSTMLAVVLLVVMMPVQVNATQTMAHNFNKNFTITGDHAEDIVSAAIAQNGRSQSSLGYTEAWCADFVCDSARVANISADIIPYDYSASGGVRYLLNYMLNNCGAVEVSTPKTGDLAFYYCTTDSNYCHVAIMIDSTDSIHGNIYVPKSQVYRMKYNAYIDPYNQKCYTVKFIRPNYGGSSSTPSEHTCNMGEYVFYEKDHPHYNCYKCTICGNIQKDDSSSNFISSCTYCAESIPEGIYYLKNKATGTYLHVVDGVDADKQNVVVSKYVSGAVYQQFEITQTTDGYKIRPLCSSSRLVNAWGASPTIGSDVNLYTDVSDSTQWWSFEEVSGGYIIHNSYVPSCVLDLDDSDVLIWSRHGGDSQIWTLEKVCDHSVRTVRGKKEATCTDEGYIGDTVCQECGEVLTTGKATDMVAHTYTEVVTPPTETSQGYTTHTCTVCGYKYKDNYTDYECQHMYSAVVTIEPTPLSPGYTMYNCTNCSETRKDDYIEYDGPDKITSITVESLPKHTGEYVIGTYYDVDGTVLRVTFASGETQLVTVEDVTAYGGSIAIKGWEYSVAAHSLIEEGENQITLEFPDVSVPVATVVGSRRITDWEILPGNGRENGYLMNVRLVYDDGSVYDTQIIGLHGTGDYDFVNGTAQTTAGFWCHWRAQILNGVKTEYRLQDIAKITDDMAIVSKDMAYIAAIAFQTNTGFDEAANAHNIDALVLSVHEMEDTLFTQSTFTKEEIEALIFKYYKLDMVDVTRSKYYKADTDTVTFVFPEDKCAGGAWYDENIQLYSENEDGFIYRYVKDGQDSIYVGIEKESGKIYWVGTSLPVGTMLLGDVTLDSRIDSSDARMTLQYAVGKINLNADQSKAANVNGDSKVDSSDARMILQYSVGKITSFS